MLMQAEKTLSIELGQRMFEFFCAVSFEPGDVPRYEDIHRLFVPSGLLIKTSSREPDIWTVEQFVNSRRASFREGALTRFREVELRGSSQNFGNIAHRFSSYAKSGVISGDPFVGRGMISTQFIKTAFGWKIAVMSWDDERAGLVTSSKF